MITLTQMVASKGLLKCMQLIEIAVLIVFPFPWQFNQPQNWLWKIRDLPRTTWIVIWGGAAKVAEGQHFSLQYI